MSAPGTELDRRGDRVRPAGGEWLNAMALLLAAGVLVALGLAWWRDHTRAFEVPFWSDASFVALSPATAGGTRGTHPSGYPRGARVGGRGTRAELGSGSEDERWVVAVNLRCSHCLAHLHALGRSLASRPEPPALAALIVDQAARPLRTDLGVPLAGGVWWDSAQVWREDWGRRAYGETVRFDARGRLLSATPAGVLPDCSPEGSRAGSPSSSRR